MLRFQKKDYAKYIYGLATKKAREVILDFGVFGRTISPAMQQSIQPSFFLPRETVNPFSAGINFSRQNLTSKVDRGTEREKYL